MLASERGAKRHKMEGKENTDSRDYSTACAQHCRLLLWFAETTRDHYGPEDELPPTADVLVKRVEHQVQYTFHSEICMSVVYA